MIRKIHTLRSEIGVKEHQKKLTNPSLTTLLISFLILKLLN